MKTNVFTEDACETQLRIDAETPAAWRMPTAAFRARQAVYLLTRAERDAIATRPRFYSMPWLKFNGLADPDDLAL